MPITLAVSENKAFELKGLFKITLVDAFNYPLAILEIEDIYKPDFKKECLSIYGTLDSNHPSVEKLLKYQDLFYIGGPLLK